MKKLFEFTLEQTRKVKQSNMESDPKTGEDIEVMRDFDQITKRKFFIRKPSRSLRDSADLFYSQQFSFLVKEGVLTIAQLSKRFDDDGGIFSERENGNDNLYFVADALVKKRTYCSVNNAAGENRLIRWPALASHETAAKNFACRVESFFIINDKRKKINPLSFGGGHDGSCKYGRVAIRENN